MEPRPKYDTRVQRLLKLPVTTIIVVIMNINKQNHCLVVDRYTLPAFTGRELGP